MHAYLENTRFASETLFKAIFQEDQDLQRLRRELAAAEPEAAMLERGAQEYVRFGDPNDDNEGLGQLRVAEAWDARVHVTRLSRGVDELTRSIADKEQATVALCGALLQIAKFGITGTSVPKQGKLCVSQSGRRVDGLPLEEIIWGGRNQSMHHESPPLSHHTVTKKVFDTLGAKYGSRFDATAGKDVAREVVNLLGWTDIDKYHADMASILP